MANLVRWDPFRELMDMDRLLDRVFRGGDVRRRGQALEQAFKTPALDVYDKKDRIVVKAELPGIDKKDVKVNVAGEVLTIRGETTGALQVINKRNGAPFTGEDSELLTALAQQIAVALDNAKLYNRLEENFKLTAEELKITQQKLIGRSDQLP